ncbi:MAG: VapE domain-containing protein [Dehalococcoidia bacterium]
MDRAEVLRSIDISTSLRQLGIDISRENAGRAECRCPLHEDNNPSFIIDLEDSGQKKKGRWKCYAGCTSKLGNSIFDLAIELGYASNFEEAVKYLTGGELKMRKPKTLRSKGKVTVNALQKEIDPEIVRIQKEALWADTLALNYLRIERGIESVVLEEYAIGLSRDRNGTSITLHQGPVGTSFVQTKHIRFPKGEGEGPRFWSSKGFKAILWPPPCLDSKIFDHVIVVESELDALFLQSCGLNATAVCGTAGFSVSRLKPVLESDLNVFIMPDWDEAGTDAANKLCDEINQRYRISYLTLGPWNSAHKDVGDYFKLYGKEKTLAPILEAIQKGLKYDSNAWSSIDFNDNNKVKKHIGNLRAIVESDEKWRGYLWRNEMSGMDMLGDRRICDEDITRAQCHMHDEYGVSWGVDETHNMIRLVCSENLRHPVRDYLNQLKWDGVPRIDIIVTKYMTLPKTEIHGLKAVFVGKWLVSAVARVMKPGCQVDSMLVLFSRKQGIGKSRFARALAGEHFLDQPIDPHNKDEILAAHRNWIIEVGELDATTRKRDMSSLRGFLSKREDTIRSPYSRVSSVLPRSFVFMGTTNDPGVVKEEGGRRYWPLEVLTIDVEAVKKDRDQLWAEAVALYQKGVSWHLSEDEDDDRQDDMETNFQDIDPIRFFIDEWCLENRLTGVAIQDISLACRDKGFNTHPRAIAAHLNVLGYERVKITSGPDKDRRRWVKAAP